ncbi:MAG: hypothetical protein JNL63_03180 [Bacteroidia bacterium]|nr:hypothetical protein [Bacteroidia bacterium]
MKTIKQIILLAMIVCSFTSCINKGYETFGKRKYYNFNGVEQKLSTTSLNNKKVKHSTPVKTTTKSSIIIKRSIGSADTISLTNTQIPKYHTSKNSIKIRSLILNETENTTKQITKLIDRRSENDSLPKLNKADPKNVEKNYRRVKTGFNLSLVSALLLACGLINSAILIAAYVLASITLFICIDSLEDIRESDCKKGLRLAIIGFIISDLTLLIIFPGLLFFL